MKRWNWPYIISWAMVLGWCWLGIWASNYSWWCIAAVAYILGAFLIFEYRVELKRFWRYLVWRYDGKPEPEPKHDQLSFVRTTGMGPFRLPGEKRRMQEARKYVKILRENLEEHDGREAE